MARKAQFIPSTTADGLIPMEDIPDDVKTDMEDAYKAISQNDGRIRFTFDDKAELELFFKQAVSYCRQHEPVWKARKSPTRNLPDNVMDLRVTADLEANGSNRDNNGEQRPRGASAGSGRA